MLKVAGRIIIVIFAFFFSVLSALIMMVLLGGRELGSAYKAEIADLHPFESFVIDVYAVAQFVHAIGPALTILPALLAVIVGEVIKIRSIIYYLLAGGLAVLAIPFLYETGDGIKYVAPNARYMTIFAASGFVSGFLYWALAGRRA